MKNAYKHSAVIRFLAYSCLIAAPAGAADPGNAQWNAATQLFKSGDYRHALPALNNLEGSYPRNEKIHYMIGVCYKNLGRQELAERELKWVASGWRKRMETLRQCKMSQLFKARLAAHVGSRTYGF